MLKMFFTRVKGQPCDLCYDRESQTFAVFFHDDYEFVTWRGGHSAALEAIVNAAIEAAADRINAKRGVR